MNQNLEQQDSNRGPGDIQVRIIETENSHKCNLFDYASSYAGNLMRHLKTHSGEKSNKCIQCGFASVQAGDLRTHLKTHSGEKSNKCNQCDYATSLASNLMRHLKTHSGEKSNKCNKCEYACIQAGDLRRHLKTHSGEKSSKCNLLRQGPRLIWVGEPDKTNFASSHAGNLRIYISKRTVEKNQVNPPNVTLHLPSQPI